jgi:WD40 repeat protein
MAFGPEGKTFASTSVDGTVRLWDVATHRQLGKPILSRTYGTVTLAFSPDGKTLATGSDRAVRLWDVATHRQLGNPLTGHTTLTDDPTMVLAFSPDGKTLASGADDKTVRLWDVATRRPLGDPLTGHSGRVVSLAFSPDGKTLASGGDDQDQTVRLWDIATRKLIGDPYPVTSSYLAIGSVAFTRDGKTLAAESAATVWHWDVGYLVDTARYLCAITGRSFTRARNGDTTYRRARHTRDSAPEAGHHTTTHRCPPATVHARRDDYVDDRAGSSQRRKRTVEPRIGSLPLSYA